MNHNFPVYTTENECQDCYKCVRHCPCKAIKVINGRASVMPDLCVSCGICVVMCPAHAKQIRDDLSKVKFMLGQGRKVIVSLAPSYVSHFRGVKPENMIAALLKLGFYGVSETALGAQMVSSHTAELLRSCDNGLFISSACPAAVDYISKYLPDMKKFITPVLSPVMAHCKLLRRKYGEDIAIVFIGPCAAKKNEADHNEKLLDAALTFEELKRFLQQENIDLNNISPDPGSKFIPENADEGRFYSIEGGMNETLRGDPTDKTCYLAVSGLQNIKRILSNSDAEEIAPNRRVFLEVLACSGGCVNGPVMSNNGNSLSGLIAAADTMSCRSSVGRQLDENIEQKIATEAVPDNVYSDAAIKTVLSAIGKHSIEDELNCGGCGYFTCRNFAKAILAGKAENAMCLSFLKKQAQNKSNALVKYIPAGVVIVDRHLRIIECNRHFADLFDESTQIAYEATPGLPGVDLKLILDFYDLFESVLESGKEIVRNNYMYGDRILDIAIFSIDTNHTAGAIIQDVTQAELRREQISEKAREVIKKNVVTVQQIAHLLGEHMAETEILLREVASGYDHKTDPEKKDAK
ncbi:MAG: 4Fe-4S binding protein [Lentisphaeria bacterium]|nr:4Fe-4S binding protein [Lentisphaeria bacterium]